jgi:hypothetical protein
LIDKGITKHQIVQEFTELRWQIDKMNDWKWQMSVTEEEHLNQSQSAQFFLGLGSSQVVKTDESI